MSETLSGKLKYSKGVSEFMYVGVRFMDIVVHFHTSANSLGEILCVAAKYPYMSVQCSPCPNIFLSLFTTVHTIYTYQISRVKNTPPL